MWRAAVTKIYESLALNDAVRRADLIFVVAGRMGRKQYGLVMFKAGWGTKLVLSVGRFEVSKMAKLDLSGLRELITLRDQTPPHERHFFLTVDGSGVRIEKIGLPRWSTYGEALALRSFVESEKLRRVIII